MNRLIVNLVISYFVGALNIAAGFAAEGLGVPQTQSGGGVTVKVTYLAQTEHEAKFSVVLDTHSVNLERYAVARIGIVRSGQSFITAEEAVKS
jgi:hypothetical protein